MADEPVVRIEPHEEVLHVVVLRRSLDSIASEAMTEEVLAAAAARPGVPVVMDVSQVRFAPSVALGGLVQMSHSLRLEGRRLALFGVQRRVYDTILVAHLDQVLEIHPSLEDALKPRTERP